MKKKCFLILITLLFINCSVTKDLNAVWKGKTSSELVRSFGIPNSKVEKTTNEKIFTYIKKKRVPSYLGKSKHFIVVKTNIFFINKFDKIYKVIQNKKTLK